MILTFQNWVITKPPGSLGYQYDNDSQVLTLGGTLPEGYIWDALVQSGQNFDVWNLQPGENGPSITLSEDNLASTGEYYVQIRGTNGDVVQHTNIVTLFVPRSLVGPGTWPTLPTEFSQAEQNIQELNAHPPTPGENGYWMLWNLETSSYQESQIPIPGLQINIGTTTTGEPGTQASVTNSGTPTDPVFNFVIPAGENGKDGQDGSPGPAPTLSAGEVTTLPPGDPATVTVSGQYGSYQIGFGIPQGQPGSDGAQINDDAISTTETWSSSNIVNTLCPPFSVSGNPVTCNPVANYPLDVSASFLPIQDGEGDPSPENVRPISGWDSLQVIHSNDAESSDTYDIALPETVYGGTVDFVNGKSESDFGYKAFNGEELWAVYTSSFPSDNTSKFVIDISSSIGGSLTSICSHFKNVATAWAKDEPWIYGDNTAVSSGRKYFLVPKSEFPDLDSWKSYLSAQYASGTPVTIAYQLATPEAFEVTPHPILALPGANTLYTDGDSVTVTGKQDLSYAIQQLQAQSATTTAVTNAITGTE